MEPKALKSVRTREVGGSWSWELPELQGCLV